MKITSVVFLVISVLGCGSGDEPLAAKTENPKTENSNNGKPKTAVVTNSHEVKVIRVPDGGKVPDTEIDAEGVIHMAYLARDNVYYVKSSDEGQTFNKPIRVNSEKGFAAGGAHRGPDLAVGNDGRIHVVWYNAGYQQKRPKEQWGVMYSRLNVGATAFAPSRNLNRKPSDNFSLAADGKGNVAVIWMAGGIYANLSKDGGDNFSSPVDLKTDPCECCGSRAIYAKDGSLMVLYRDKADDYRDTYLAVLPQGGQKFTHVKTSQKDWYITNCPMTGSFLGTTKNGLVAAWRTKEQIFFAHTDNAGKRLPPGEIRVTKQGRFPVALTAPNGFTLLAWKNNKKMNWQLFDAKGNPTDQQGSSSIRTTDRPSGVVTKNGTFLIFP